MKTTLCGLCFSNGGEGLILAMTTFPRIPTAIPDKGLGKTLPTCGRHEKGNLRTYNCRMLLERNKRRVHLQAGALSPTFSQGECICWFSFRTMMVDYFDRSCGRGLSSSNPYRLGSLLSTAQYLQGRKEQRNQRKGFAFLRMTQQRTIST